MDWNRIKNHYKVFESLTDKGQVRFIVGKDEHGLRFDLDHEIRDGSHVAAGRMTTETAREMAYFILKHTE